MIRAYQYNEMPFKDIAKTKKDAQKLIKSLKIFEAVIKDEYTATIKKGTFHADISLKFLGIDTHKHEKGEMIDLVPEENNVNYKGLPTILKCSSRFISVKDKDGFSFWGNEQFLIRGECPVTPEHLNFYLSSLILNGKRKQYNRRRKAMFQYNEVLKKVVPGNFSRVSGYFGERENCKFAIVNNKLLEVYPFGCFHSAIIPSVQDEAELNWLIDHHPNMKRYYRRENKC